MHLIKAHEVLRAIDAFLIKFDCPECADEQLTGTDFSALFCKNCGDSYANYGLDVSDATHRIVASSLEKRRKKGIGKKTVLLLLSIQDHKCAYCDCCVKEKEYHIDHIIPFSVGGTNNLNNLAVTCSLCNLIASSKVFPSFLAKKLFIVTSKRNRV